MFALLCLLLIRQMLLRRLELHGCAPFEFLDVPHLQLIFHDVHTVNEHLLCLRCLLHSDEVFV